MEKLSNLFFGHLDFLDFSSCKGFLALHFLLAITLVCCQVVVSCWPQRYWAQTSCFLHAFKILSAKQLWLCKDFQKYSKVFQDIQIFSKIFKDFPRYSKNTKISSAKQLWLCKDTQKNSKIFQEIQRFSKIFKDFPRYSKKYKDIECKAVVTLQRYSTVFKYFQKYSKIFKYLHQ